MNTIAVIDDGISDVTIPDLQFDIIYSPERGFIKNNRPADPFSHGSICAAIIAKYAPNAKIGSIKILDELTLAGKCSHFIKAILWCVEHKIRIIHLSIGTVDPGDFQRLMKVSHYAWANDIIIIAAGKNDDSFTLPASCSNVIGVVACRKYTEDQYAIALAPNRGINFVASSRHKIRLTEEAEDYIPQYANSFAAPVITAHVYNWLQKQKQLDFDSAVCFLAQNSYGPRHKVQDYFFIYEADFPPVSNRIVIESNHTFSALHNQIQIKLDNKHELRAFINQIKEKEIGIILKEPEQKPWSDVRFLLNLLWKQKKCPVLAFCMPINKIVFHHRLYVPGMLEKYYELNIQYRECPVIILYGTESRQIAMALKKYFYKDHYHPLLFSDCMEYFLDGFYYIEKNKIPACQWFKMSHQVNADLVLFVVTECRKFKQFADLIVCCGESEWDMAADLNINEKPGLIKTIYLKIVELLSE